MSDKKIYILLTDTGTLFTRMIKLYTKQPLNHASIAFDQELKELYSFGRKYQSIPFIGGFVKENIHSRLFRQAKCAVYSCSVSDEQFSGLQDSISSVEQNQKDYKYNLLGLLGVMMNKDFERKNAYFCSQFVATILKESGISVFEKPAALITPQDLSEEKRFVLEYKGELQAYPPGIFEAPFPKYQPSEKRTKRFAAINLLTVSFPTILGKGKGQ